ncbi:MAG: 1-acyl-sn-glycerol-3-phosphate acyltransferase [Ruminococcaceae bacterium]|nr:1-acyl-sn-glycerol-3-phosphate acyltransferase [Oscillospiraceae bacterium]
MKVTFGIRVGRVLLAILRPLIFCLFPYRFVHREKLPKVGGKFIVCCNHISVIDPVFLLLACRFPIYYMAKEEIFRNRLIGWFLRTCFGVFPVSRGKGDTTAITTAMNLLDNQKVLGIFPEGTRSKDGKLGVAKAGTSMIAVKTQSPIFPCAIFAKNGKVRLFQKTTVVFGDMLTLEDLHLHGEKPDIRFATRKIMSVIGEMIEENRV